MRELLTLFACIAVPILTFRGCVAVQEVFQMRAEIQTAHERALLPLPPPRVVPANEDPSSPATISSPGALAHSQLAPAREPILHLQYDPQ